MCGFVGYIEKDQNDVLPNMLEQIKYRGPDSLGVFKDNIDDKYINLGHVRLSILDTSSLGNQPFVSDCNNYIIVYNGEVYNFKTIREELIVQGYKFNSDCDTEVILYAYKHWGIKCLDKFIGMFGFSILDKIKQKIFLVRDRAGVKPVYYYFRDELFLFGSEIKTFHKHPKFKKVLNKNVLGYYFQFGYIPAPWSVFNNCYKLQPGHYLEYDIVNNSYDIHKYWDIIDFYSNTGNLKSESLILKELEELLIDSCKLRMISDVPVGVFLSGGYDSSLVSAILQKHHNNQIQTFTIGFLQNEYNEASHAKLVASYLGTKHTEYYCTKDDLLEIIEDLPSFFDEPFADSSAIPTILVSNIAKKEVSVVLSADGGDEVFFGYSKYFALDLISNINIKIFKVILNTFSVKMIKRLNKLVPKSIRPTNVEDKFNKLKRALNSSTNREMFVNASSLISKSDVEKMLLPECIQSISKTNFKDFDKLNQKDIKAAMMATDYKTFMLDDVLTKVDRATMSVSLEGREPLLDHRLSEYMASVSSNLKYKNKEGKYLLRQVLYKYIPKEMIDKPKSGFNIPIGDWLQTDLQHIISKYLSNDRIVNSGIYNVAEIERLKEEFFNKKNNSTELTNKIWHILCFEMWQEKWLTND